MSRLCQLILVRTKNTVTAHMPLGGVCAPLPVCVGPLPSVCCVWGCRECPSKKPIGGYLLDKMRISQEVKGKTMEGLRRGGGGGGVVQAPLNEGGRGWERAGQSQEASLKSLMMTHHLRRKAGRKFFQKDFPFDTYLKMISESWGSF